MDVEVVLGKLSPVAGRVALLVDYDGTLAPTVNDPELAVPLPGMIDALRRLTAAGLDLGVVSGRPVEFLRRHVVVEGAVLVGQYGLERDVDGRAVATDERSRDFAPAVRAATAVAQQQFGHLHVEPKGDLAVTIHWREAGAVDDTDLAAMAGLAADYGLWVHETRMARELRVPVAVDKGSAVTKLLAEFGSRAVLFGGDDRGDLAAFDALDAAIESGMIDVAIKVGVWSTEAPGELIERADIVVAGPEGFLDLLSNLVAL
jgi:trehalose 6-phosphate phosphatase